MLKEKLRSQVLGGCLQDFKDHLSGNYKGFYITLNACAGRYIFTVNAYSPNDAGNQQLNTYLQQHSGCADLCILCGSDNKNSESCEKDSDSCE